MIISLSAKRQQQYPKYNPYHYHRKVTQMKNNKILQYGLLIITALILSYISAVYIPYSVELLAIDRATLRELVPGQSDFIMWVSGSDCATVSFLPDTAVAELSWSSADQSVARIKDDGSITATGAGQTTLTVTSNNGVSTTVNVQVISKALPPDSDLPPLYHEPLVIANRQVSLGEDYKPELLTTPSSFPAVRSGMQMTPETLEAYTKMYNDCKAATGQGFILISAYRSYQKQVSLFNEDVASYMRQGYSRARAEELTARSTQYPGHSEHQIGQTVDIGNSWALNYTFYKTTAGAWVTANAHRYGFILRYPADKVDKTGIDYEAWHFRYVGVEHATYIYEHGLCLEEYIELQQQAAIVADHYSQQISAGDYLELINAPAGA